MSTASIQPAASRRSNLDPNLAARAAPLPIATYFDAAWFAREMKTLFGNGAGYSGHMLMVPGPGDDMTLLWTEHGKALVRAGTMTETGAGAGGTSLLSNVCRHRQGLILDGRGNAPNLESPMHRWTYDLEGKLPDAPDFDVAPDCAQSRTPLDVGFGLRMKAYPLLVPTRSRVARPGGTAFCWHHRSSRVCPRPHGNHE